jgi:hypothetical protein
MFLAHDSTGRLNGNKKGDEKMEHTVFTVPNNKPWVLTKEEAEEFLKDAPIRKMTKEERTNIIKDAEKLFKKPEKKTK